MFTNKETIITIITLFSKMFVVTPSFIKTMAFYHEWDALEFNRFEQCSFEDLKPGDVVMSVVSTYSQKYMMYEGYEEYNMKKIGVLLTKEKKNPDRSVLYQKMFNEDYGKETDDFKEVCLYSDPGTSGYVILYKYRFDV
jgi:hypothetical protein